MGIGAVGLLLLAGAVFLGMTRAAERYDSSAWMTTDGHFLGDWVVVAERIEAEKAQAWMRWRVREVLDGHEVLEGREILVKSEPYSWKRLNGVALQETAILGLSVDGPETPGNWRFTVESGAIIHAGGSVTGRQEFRSTLEALRGAFTKDSPYVLVNGRLYYPPQSIFGAGVKVDRSELRRCGVLTVVDALPTRELETNCVEFADPRTVWAPETGEYVVLYPDRGYTRGNQLPLDSPLCEVWLEVRE